MSFLKVYGVILIFCFIFAMFGGLVLFDFSKHWFLAIASRAFIIAAVVYVFCDQDDRIKQLEQKIKGYEDKEETTPDK